MLMKSVKNIIIWKLKLVDNNFRILYYLQKDQYNYLRGNKVRIDDANN